MKVNIFCIIVPELELLKCSIFFEVVHALFVYIIEKKALRQDEGGSTFVLTCLSQNVHEN